MTDVNEEIVATLDNLEALIEMVMDRDAGDALKMVTMIHEVAKLYAADQLPKAERVTSSGLCTESLEIVFSGRNVRTARNLIEHLHLWELDDDGIPI